MVKTYSKYKDSGAPWFGDVPDHWETPRLGAVLKERKEVNKANEVTKILSVMRDVGVIPYEEKGNVGNKCSEDITRYKIVRPGDIVANCMNIIIGSVGISKYTGCLSPVYYVLTPRSDEDDSQFFDYVFKVKAFQQSLVRLGNGILAHRMRIPMELLKCEIVPKPPLVEQKVIAEYFDAINKMFHRYIRSKQQVIKLLNEQKQAIINKAVTKGINPNVRFKPSGVEWIGDVPEHWDVRKLRRVCNIVKTGNTPSGADEKYYSIDGYNWYTPGDFKQGIYLEKSKRQLSQLGIESVRSFPKGAVMMIGIGATIGKVSVTTVEASCNQQINALVVNEEMQKEYFAYYLRSLKDYIVMCGKYTTLPIINQDETKSLPVLVPSKTEQKSIVDHIEAETRALNTAIDIEERSIDSIREYRTRLISDVVTGKIDVRDVKLPDLKEVLQESIDEQEMSEDIEDSEEVVNADE